MRGGGRGGGGKYGKGPRLISHSLEYTVHECLPAR